MEEVDVLECLLEVAAAANLHIEIAGRDARSDSERPLASGVCRVRGQWWVILSRADPVSAQIQMLARALKTHALDVVEARHLPPAVRAVIDEMPRGS